jgi:hypothetical protein
LPPDHSPGSYGKEPNDEKRGLTFEHGMLAIMKKDGELASTQIVDPSI